MNAAAAAPGRRAPAPPCDLDALRRELLAEDGTPYAVPAWWSEGVAAPGVFWAQLGPALLSAPPGSSRSTLLERYALGFELGARHAGAQDPAFLRLDAAAGVEVTTYARLADAARGLAADWQARGVAPGAVVAITAPLSPELVVALLAAWHVGALPAPLPVRGRTYLRDRLAAAAPDRVATRPGLARWLELSAEELLPVAPAGEGGDPGPAYRYASGEAALRAFSSLGDAPLTPVDVPAGRLYLGALRDGALFLGLGVGRGAAAPGFCEVQFGLPLLLSCLATGAHYVDVAHEAACADPGRVCDGRVHVLGVSERLRDAILAADPAGRGPERWFRSPAAAHDPARWGHAARARALARARGACWFPSPVAGGALTWSPWRRDPALNLALPAPGLPWQLVDPGRGGVPSADGNGVLTVADPAIPPEALGRPLLGRIGGEALWVASIGAHRDGQRLPAAEIEALVLAVHGVVSSCCVLDDPRLGAVLVAFARPDRVPASGAARPELARAIADTIASELAPELVPARVEVFTVAPRAGADGRIDREWCRGQHVSGLLDAKQDEPVFGTIARLRQLVEAAPPRAAAG